MINFTDILISKTVTHRSPAAFPPSDGQYTHPSSVEVLLKFRRFSLKGTSKNYERKDICEIIKE